MTGQEWLIIILVAYSTAGTTLFLKMFFKNYKNWNG